ncbi:MAG: thrombospondin type 3 repeat-containing protein, partial [Thermoplasmatota archaeon]
TVGFVDQSTHPGAAIASWAWSFGDGGTSTVSSPSHLYPPAGGVYTVTLNVVDGNGLSSTATHDVTAFADTNCCPLLEPVGDLVVMEGRFIRIQLNGFDPDQGPLQYTMSGEVPAGADLDAFSGLLEWATERGDAGIYHIVFTLTDGECAVTQDATFTVNPRPVHEPMRDTDMDGIADDSDLCPSVPDQLQWDTDVDGTGDACDPSPCGLDRTGAALPCDADGPSPRTRLLAAAADLDQDGVADASDNCPQRANRGQGDMDGDSLGDVCDPDIDGDGLLNLQPAGLPVVLDNCPLVPNRDQADSDGNGAGDRCDGLAAASPARARDGEPAAAASVPSPLSASALAVALTLVAGAGATVLVVAAIGRRSKK